MNLKTFLDCRQFSERSANCQKLISQSSVEAFAVTVLSPAFWFDVKRLDAKICKPRLHSFGNELRTMMAAHVFGSNAPTLTQVGQQANDVLTGYAVIDFDR